MNTGAFSRPEAWVAKQGEVLQCRTHAQDAHQGQVRVIHVQGKVNYLKPSHSRQACSTMVPKCI